MSLIDRLLNRKYKRILSLDGGGVRIISSVRFLHHLEKETGKTVFELFDYFIGVSAGGATALLITLNQLNAQKLEDFWSQENLEKIMYRTFWDKSTFFQNKPKYKEDQKVEIFRQYFKGSKLQDAQKPVSVLAYDVGKRAPRIISSFNDQHLLSRKVVAATSAAPLYYPTVNLEDDAWLIDGGVVANNPCLVGYNEARKYFNTDRIKVFSVGTGLNKRKIDGEASTEWGAFGWLKNDIIGVLMESHLDHEILSDMLKKNYMRVNSSIGDANFMMDDYSTENIEKLKKLGDDWWEKFGNDSIKFFE